LRRRGLWPPIVPRAALAESRTGSSKRDVNTNLPVEARDVRSGVAERVVRRGRGAWYDGSEGLCAVDALVVAAAEPGSTALTSDGVDLRAIAADAVDVVIEVT
jgi:hypothetical protein